MVQNKRGGKMKYTIASAEDVKHYLTNDFSMVIGEPGVNQCRYDDVTGIGSVNGDGSKQFFIQIPIENLKIGDKIKASVDLKIKNGAPSPRITSGFGKNGFVLGNEGNHRVVSMPSREYEDFETLTLEFVYEGYKFSTASTWEVTNKNTGFQSVALYVPANYGAFSFDFKNFSVETTANAGGLKPGVKMYFGGISYSPSEGLSFSGGSQNFKDFELTYDSGIFTLKLGATFKNNVSTFFNTSIQTDGNNSLYEFKVRRNLNDSVSFSILDILNNTLVGTGGVSVPIYGNFLIIAE